MSEYIRKVNYHETDKMGITHHSNYIKWLEEARIDYLEKIGCSYAKLEKDGIISPVISLECAYKRPTTFGDTVRINVEIEEFKRMELIFKYEITNTSTGELVFTGRTHHCFTNEHGMPIALKRSFPELDALLKSLVKE
ncbi:MAG: acyl-CoA thioesterase [Clostridia bacterium]|nr:acyl-CoA thioesterase [Clostridia bacterium]